MRDLLLVDPRVQRARLFQEAIALCRRRAEFARGRAEQSRAEAFAGMERARHLVEALNSVASRRHESGNGDEVRLHVFDAAPPAIDYLKRSVGERPAVVFTDVYLLGSSGVPLSGIEVVTAIKKEPGLRHVPTVLLDTGASPDRVREAWRAGSSAVVHLPVELPGMLLRVADAVEFWFRTAAL